MTAAIGVNVRRDAQTTPESVAFLGARWVRVVLMPDVDLNPWIDRCHALGVKVLGVIARESLGLTAPTARWSYPRWLESIAAASSNGRYRPPPRLPGASELDFSAAVAMYADRYGRKLDAVQGGNEADHWSPSSWHMEPDELNRLLAAICDRFEPPIICASMVSGQPGYMDGINPGLYTALSVHPYGRRPSNAEDWSGLPGNFGTVTGLLDQYRCFGKPMWITECGVPTTQVSPEFQARYCRELLSVLKLDRDVQAATWFAMSDDMVEGFGLFDDQGRPKPAASEFLSVAGPLVPPTPQPDDPCRDDRERVARVRALAEASPYLKPSRKKLLAALA